MRAKNILVLAVLIATGTFVVSCANSQKEEQNNIIKDTSTEQVISTSYYAELTPLNSEIVGSETKGEAVFQVDGDSMMVMIHVTGAPAGIEHWQHFHGFIGGEDASIATMADDANGDGIVDVVETGKNSGTTMVPFNAIPTAMNLADNTYPVADQSGFYHYQVKIPMSELKAAFGKAFNGSPIDLEKRVLYIHGVPSSTKLPKTVQSVGNIPAQVTLPIACGKIIKDVAH